MLVDNLQGFCLIASEKLKYNSYFSNSLVFIYESNSLYSKGLIINKCFDLKKDYVNDHSQQIFDFASENNLELLCSGPIAFDCCFAIKKKQYACSFEVGFMDCLDGVGNKPVCLGLGNVVWSNKSFLDDVTSGRWDVFDVGEAGVFNLPLAERFEYAKDSIGFSAGCLFSDKVGNG